MANDIIQLPPDSTGKKVAARSYTESANTVYAQAGYITTDTAGGNPVEVNNTSPASNSYGLFVRGLLFDPETGSIASQTSSRDHLVAQRYIMQQDSLANGIDTASWTTTTASGGTATVTAGEALLSTSANATGAATLAYVAAVPFQPGQQHFFAASIRVGDTGAASNIRRWGAFTVSGVVPQEGFAFELNDAAFNVVSYKAGTPTRVASGSFSRNAIAPFTIDTNYHVYEIRYSGTAAYFYIDGVLRHVMTTTTTPLTATMDFPMGLSNINTATASNRVLACRNIAIGRFGHNNSISGNQSPVSTAAWTSGTAGNTALTIPVFGMNTVTVAMHNTSTMTAGVLSFEVSPDNVNWFPIALARIDSYTVETTYTLNTVADRSWSTSVDGFNYFRVRLSTAITGSGTASVFVTAQTLAIEPIVSVGQSVAANLQAQAQILPGTTGGLTISRVLSAATTNATSVKASAGQVFGWSIFNNAAATKFVKLYNKASAPTVGTDTPVMTIPIPAGGGSNIMSDSGIAFATGIALAITGVVTDADATAVALNDITLNLFYK